MDILGLFIFLGGAYFWFRNVVEIFRNTGDLLVAMRYLFIQLFVSFTLFAILVAIGVSRVAASCLAISVVGIGLYVLGGNRIK